MAQRSDGFGGFLAGVDQIFGQCADDAIAPCIYLTDLVFVFACGLDHAAGGSIDDGCDAAGLSIKRVFSGHSCTP